MVIREMIERTLIADDAQGKLKPEGMYTRPRLPSMVMKSDGLELPLRGKLLEVFEGTIETRAEFEF